MRFLTLKGKYKNKNISNYLIDWDAPSRSKYQFKLKQFLKLHCNKHHVCEEFPVVGTRMTLDIVDFTKKIAYEMQGEAHTQFLPFMHSNSRSKFLSQINRDSEKRKWCELNDFILIEIFPEDLDKLNVEWFKKELEIDIRF